MVFQSHTYSVLMVSPNESFGRATLPLLPVSVYHPIVSAASAGEARRRLSMQQFDLVLINTPLSDEFGIDLARDLSENGTIGVVLFVKNDSYESAARAMDQGVFVLSKPTSPLLLKQALQILCATQQRLRRLEQRQAAAEQEMRLIHRAKWILAEQQNFTEEEAHRYIVKRAMDLRISRKEVAQGILDSNS